MSQCGSGKLSVVRVGMGSGDQEVCPAAVVLLQCFSQVVDFICQTRDASLLQQGTLREFCSGREPKIYQELSSLETLNNLIK